MSMAKPIRRQCCSGFTLLEVLVAMAIMGMVVAGLFSLLSGSLSNLRRVDAASRAAQLGKAKMTELLLERGVAGGESVPSVLAAQGKTEGRWDNLTRWEATASELASPAEAAFVQNVPMKIVLVVHWRESTQDSEKAVVLETAQLWRKRRDGV